MAPDPLLKIELLVRTEHPQLLEGLESWLQLGLISDRQVRQLCQEYLTCRVVLAATPVATSTNLVDDFATDFVADFITANPQPTPTPPAEPFPSTPARPAPRPPAPRPPITPPAQPSWLSRRLQSLAAEISVIWLLVLGVFMVVVSSGVLAASQWRNVPPAGQYSILLVYTLAFWGAGTWSGQQANLRLTARMLQITTLLIIPVNVWMMDGFRLWQTGLGWVVVAIATLSLTGITLHLLRPERPPWTILANSIGLSWLHWGWAFPGIPLLASYLGTIGTTLILVRQTRQSSTAATPSLPLSWIAIAFATLLLLGRAMLIAQIPPSQLGLALGLCGWLLCWLTRRDPQPGWLPTIGTSLLLLGWAVSALAEPPWQAIAVSFLGLWLLADQIQRSWQASTLTAIFLIGLQTTWLMGRLLPPPLRDLLLERCTELVGTTGMPVAFFGVVLLPYIGLTLWFTSRLRHWQQPALADHGETMALVLGVALTTVSLPNPHLRSLNLLVSTGLLAIATRRHSHPYLIYLTHAVGVGAIASTLYSLFPDWSYLTWATVLLGGMVGEWAIAATSALPMPWRQSAWWLGLGLAAVSYSLLGQFSLESSWIWLIVPTGLTLLATRSAFFQPILAAWLSLAALIAIQPLTLGFPEPRLVGLGVATGLMLVNTAKVRHLGGAIATIGFGLNFLGAGLWQFGGEQWTWQQWLVVPAIALALLWLLRDLTHRRNTPLARLYAQAADGWAIGSSTGYLILLTFIQVALWSQTTLGDGQLVLPFWELVLALGITVGAIAYRLWQQPTDIGFYGLAWAGELLIASLVAWSAPSLTNLGIATLVLGLATQLLGDGWVNRTQQAYRPSWHTIPLLYGAIGLLFQHTTFTSWTGLYTLAGALTGMGVGRRHAQLQPFSYLSLLLVSAAAYELVIYQLLQAQGGEPADGFVVLGAVAGVLALSYRLSARWLRSVLNIGLGELRAIANLHWGGGTALLGLTVLLPRSQTGAYLWVGVALLLAGYALALGNRNWAPALAPREAWTFGGIGVAIVALSYLLYLVNPDLGFWLGWGGAIACPLAMAMYSAPWETWGWPAIAWQQSAILLPGVLAVLSALGITLPALLLIAAFYAWLARVANQIRLSYLTVLFTNWAILRFFVEQNLQEPLWYCVLLTATLLYVAQIDPALRQQSARDERHLLRMLAVGLLCATALYQSEVGSAATTFRLGLLTLGISVGLILVGLSLRVRAFLYVGTVTFVFKVLRQLWVFIADYSLLLWAIGIVLGLAFIWIAATFEARRSQVNALVQYWMTELDTWD